MGVAHRLPIWIFKKIQIGGKEQWHTTTERQSADGGSGKKEEKILRECGVDEETIEEIRTFDREEFNSDRRFYTRLNDVGEYIAETAMQEPPMEVNTVWDMLNEIEDENLYRALLTVDKRTLQIVLLKMQGYSLKEIAPMVDLSAGAVYARLDHLRKKLRKLL